MHPLVILITAYNLILSALRSDHAHTQDFRTFRIVYSNPMTSECDSTQQALPPPQHSEQLSIPRSGQRIPTTRPIFITEPYNYQQSCAAPTLASAKPSTKSPKPSNQPTSIPKPPSTLFPNLTSHPASPLSITASRRPAILVSEPAATLSVVCGTAVEWVGVRSAEDRS